MPIIAPTKCHAGSILQTLARTNLKRLLVYPAFRKTVNDLIDSLWEDPT